MILADSQVGQFIKVLIFVLYLPQAHPILPFLLRKLDLLLHLRMQRYLRCIFPADFDQLAHCLDFREGEERGALHCLIPADQFSEDVGEGIREVELTAIVP